MAKSAVQQRAFRSQKHRDRSKYSKQDRKKEKQALKRQGLSFLGEVGKVWYKYHEQQKEGLVCNFFST